MAVDASEGVGDAVAGIGGETGGARLVLRGGEAEVEGRAPDACGAGSAKPVLGAGADEFGGAERLEVGRAAKPGDRKAEAIKDGGVEGDTGIGRRDFLDGTAQIDAAQVEVAHRVLVGEAPAREVRREVGAPKDNREFDEIVGEHGAADDAGVTVVEPSGRETDARPEVRIGEAGR